MNTDSIARSPVSVNEAFDRRIDGAIDLVLERITDDDLRERCGDFLSYAMTPPTHYVSHTLLRLMHQCPEFRETIMAAVEQAIWAHWPEIVEAAAVAEAQAATQWPVPEGHDAEVAALREALLDAGRCERRDCDCTCTGDCIPEEVAQ
jgi:hypothetical protein